ncbi:cryptochrome/deoxyribodipyrimidine photo-lyase family protein [Tenacibaculum sp. 190524A02b]|uniref:cryptochrome/deoxyribodipyrimidine photo-lyase family protein n=1 Tax=Tenacibaculum vairaonense TaxID=3137860 RepID=UPI0031FAA3D8
MDSKEKIAVVWLKRDLRLHDNEAVFNAIGSGYKVLLLYVFEPSLYNDEHYSERHWVFIKQSIKAINYNLIKYQTKVLTITSEIQPFFSYLLSKKRVVKVFSHQETGILKTYKRDKEFTRFCRNNSIDWVENINNGVFRGREDREHWKEDWEAYMNKSQLVFSPKSNTFLSRDNIFEIEKHLTLESLEVEDNKFMQKGGRSFALKYMESFFKERYVNYAKFISKPLLARQSCSRLSPYLSWGNLSVREVYQYAKACRKNTVDTRAIDAFTSRLRWQAHFIQKFEMECIMETESINKGFHKLKKEVSKKYKKAWEEGNTGIPIVDACMRCLKATGYLNFRMRAMVVSFFTHNLWQPWQEASKYLSKVFLDFEPGIHFPQLQMQAGETGINTIRIYSPVKNGLEHDPKAEFITAWLPELEKLPVAFRHEPYKLTKLEQKLYNFSLGIDYPKPIVDVPKTRKKASDVIWQMRKDKDVIEESIRILKKHVTK